jgi:hypothetical protein
MSTRRKPSAKEIERSLIADADNPDAWEEPITVPASSSPRPSWYDGAKKAPSRRAEARRTT